MLKQKNRLKIDEIHSHKFLSNYMKTSTSEIDNAIERKLSIFKVYRRHMNSKTLKIYRELRNNLQ